MRHRTIPAILGIALIAGASLTAQSTSVRRVQPPPPGVRFADTWRPSGIADTKILGRVIDIERVPVGYARVQLRNLITGEVVEVKQADADGEYEFVVDSPGTYVIEMVMIDGYIVALSNAGSVARYETLRMPVQLPGRWDFARGSMFMTQNMSMFIGVSAANTMTAATLSLAAEQSLSTVEAGEPVSP